MWKARVKEVKSGHRETGVRLTAEGLGTREQAGPKIPEERKSSGTAA